METSFEIKIMVSRWIIVLLLPMLVACVTKTQIQLYTEHLSDIEIEHLSNLLGKNDFMVILNDHPIPVGIRSNTLIYSPLNRNIDRVNELADIMGDSSFGFPRLELTGKENHFYSRNIVGVYLLPNGGDGIRPEKEKRYSNEYNGRCDNQDVALLLHEGSKLELISFEWNEELDQEIETTFAGNWEVANGKMYLSLANQTPVEFLIERRVVGDADGYIDYQLVNVSDVPFYDNCKFKYKALKGSLP